MTNLLNQLKPIKPLESTTLNLFSDDLDLFKKTVLFLQKESKGNVEVNEAVLFEHLMSQIRADEDLMKKVKESKTRRKRTSKKASKAPTRKSKSDTAAELVQ